MQSNYPHLLNGRRAANDTLAKQRNSFPQEIKGSERNSKRMTASGGAFEAPIGPYTGDGTITWQVVASDEAGNPSSAAGPAVAASASC